MKKKFSMVLVSFAVLLLGTFTVSFAQETYTLYGMMVDTDSSGIKTSYLVKIDPEDGTVLEHLMLSDINITTLASDPATKTMYALADAMTVGEDPSIASINLCTGEITYGATITVDEVAPYFVESMAVHPFNGKIYVAASLDGDRPGDAYSEAFLEVDPATGEATFIGNIASTVQNEIDGLEFAYDPSDPDNVTLYAVDDPGQGPTSLYTLDLSTALATSKGTLNAPRINNIGDMAWNPETFKLYGRDPGAYSTSEYPRNLIQINLEDSVYGIQVGEMHTEPYPNRIVTGLDWASFSCCEPKETTLWAGAAQNDTTKGTDVGTITIWNDDTNLYIKYTITGGCYITETHLYVGTQPPIKAAPGQFPYFEELSMGQTEKTYTIPLDELVSGDVCDTSLFIAAHAVVGCDGGFYETAWGYGENSFRYFEISKKWGWIINYDICCGDEGAAGVDWIEGLPEHSDS